MYNTIPRSLALLVCFACLPAVAGEQHYNQIALRAEANSEVARDRMHVTLYTESQHKEPAQLAAHTTQTINKALKQARQVKGVSVSQGSRSSYPVYEEKGQQITAWRERAELRLESGDFAALSKLTAELMQDLKMGGMYFSVSDSIRQQNEDALLKDAVAAFRARAQLATEALGGSDYKIVSLNLNSGGNFQPEMLRSVSMKSMDAMPTPDVEAGTRQISISADGVIEVQMP
ncbi:SIMPL domain-containing protein [Stutzerimonas zhaodongensis]|uniref:SIMPL domain-containing protein n=1 Tax=Stutzerimonas TaxID=2901164 RepID=UPI0038907225